MPDNAGISACHQTTGQRPAVKREHGACIGVDPHPPVFVRGEGGGSLGSETHPPKRVVDPKLG